MQKKAVKNKALLHICPDHNVPLEGTYTKWGWRRTCSVEGCDVVQWNDNSSPANATLRAMRRRCHEQFDKFWQPGVYFKTRQKAYNWLRSEMHVPKELAHIGLFDMNQCHEVLRLCEKLDKLTSLSEVISEEELSKCCHLSEEEREQLWK